MNVLVTGGAGLIGMAVRERLAADGHGVVAVDVTDFGRNDQALVQLQLDDVARLEALVEQNGIDAIVHCGAISGPMMARGQPMLLVDVNIRNTALLLDLAQRRNMRRFIFCSSISVYGDVGDGVIVEDTPLHPSSVYGATKVASESLVEAFATEYGVEGVSFRIARVYGPYRRANCHINNIIRDVEAGQETEIPCEPGFTYHYVHVDDVADAIMAGLTAEVLPSRAYNVGGGTALTMAEIAEQARAALPGAQISLVAGADDVPDVQKIFDIGKIERELGWRPKHDIASGILSYRSAMRSGRVA